MSSFEALSPIVRAIFAFWALALCLVNVVNVTLSLVKKRYLISLVAVLLLTPAYFIWQIIFDLALFKRAVTQIISPITSAVCGVNASYWIMAFVVFTLGAVLLLIYNVRYEKNYLTTGAIKSYLDKIPCGICCWNDSGRVMFSNICMNRLCETLTGGALLNGNQFYDAVSQGIISVGDEKWRFACRDMVLGGSRLHEMIASDVTTEYAKTQALEKDKAELSRLNRELKEYTLSIDAAVRSREILQAKVNIHDEMNKLMLSTVATDGDDVEALDRIFSLWEQNALLLCMEAEASAEKKEASRIEKLAQALKLKLIMQNIPACLSEKQRGLFFTAAQEAILNAAKHAEAKTMEISFEEGKDSLRCLFSNDGIIPSESLTFAGGLSHLSGLAAAQNARVEVEVGEKFTLVLSFSLQKEGE